MFDEVSRPWFGVNGPILRIGVAIFSAWLATVDTVDWKRLASMLNVVHFRPYVSLRERLHYIIVLYKLQGSENFSSSLAVVSDASTHTYSRGASVDDLLIPRLCLSRARTK